jgi:phosphoribosylaminoimidazolecarboxamide formyltransferase / IMP cyclohydrolase
MLRRHFLGGSRSKGKEKILLAPAEKLTSPRIERAILSVSDKTGLLEFARELVAGGVGLFASGGTRRHLEEAGIPVREVSAHTGFPEMMDGRLKTLHPKIHGGILARRDRADDMASLAEQGIVPFELVVVNLYPFEATIAREGVTIDEAIEQIDIGGPTLVRGAAKNHAFVTIACEPAQYGAILEEFRTSGTTSHALRRELAGAAYAHTGKYDTAIGAYFARLRAGQGREDAEFPEQINLSLQREASLRYGENPHQAAALYAFPDASPNSLVRAKQLHGKELSYNNLLDLDSAISIARSLSVPGVAVLKHNNPCGAATAATLAAATENAWNGDPVSAFGSVLGYNAPVDAASAEFLAGPGRFVEAIVAPSFTPEALQILTTKPKWKANVRLLSVGSIEPGQGGRELRQIAGGMLCQTADDLPDDESTWQVVTATQPTAAQLADLKFAWAVCRHVKSNAIVLAEGQTLLGVGAGQMSRVDSVEIAISKAAERVAGSALASDAFFPFEDSVHRAAAAGVTALIQPGGSRRDAEVIAAANQHGLAMIFTGNRHFRH